MSVSLGLLMALSVSRLGQGQAREAGTEKSDVSGANLSRAAHSIAYALARTSGMLAGQRRVGRRFVG